MDDFDYQEDSSEINTDYSGSPMQMGNQEYEYSGEDQLEIEMYATDFENFLELKKEDVQIKQNLPVKISKENEENPAETVFVEIFRQSYSEFKKTQTFKKWQLLQNNEEIDKLVLEIFEKLKDEVQLDVQQIMTHLRQSFGMPPEEKIYVQKVLTEGDLHLEINGENTTYDELKQKGTLSNFITTQFDGTHGELEEMKELLIKL